MNYRHLYHAGNFADVIKHLVLIQIIEHLKQKEAPFFVLDTHAGKGLYDLTSVEAQKTLEASEGIQTLLKQPMPQIPPLLTRYKEIIQHFNRGSFPSITSYPGSPAMIASLIRPQDRLLANELHPEDYTALNRVMKRFLVPVKTLHLDAYMVLRANVPPKEKRGVVLIDPPFEKPDEFTVLSASLKEALNRWRHGIYMIWFPLKLHLPIAAFYQDIKALSVPKTLLIESWKHPVSTPDQFNGCGIIVLNTPWQLDTTLSQYTPFLHQTLFSPPAPGIRTRWLVE